MEFTVYGREPAELAEEIISRLPLVEPIIAAHEKHRDHQEAIRKADRLGKELKDICHPPLEANTDPKTMREQPLKFAA